MAALPSNREPLGSAPRSLTFRAALRSGCIWWPHHKAGKGPLAGVGRADLGDSDAEPVGKILQLGRDDRPAAVAQDRFQPRQPASALAQTTDGRSLCLEKTG
jgi:hypothetical protein